MMKHHYFLSLLVIFYACLSICECRSPTPNWGILANAHDTSRMFLVMIDDRTLNTFSDDPKKAKVFTLRRLEKVDGCSALPAALDVNGRFVAELSNFCTLQRQMELAMEAGAVGLLVVAKANFSHYPIRLDVRPDSNGSSIPVAVITTGTYNHFLNASRPQGDNISMVLYNLPPAKRGYLTIIMFHLLAFLCLVTGMWTSVHGLKGFRNDYLFGAPQTRSYDRYQPVRRQEGDTRSPLSTRSGVILVTVFLCFAAGILLLLYFFYDIFVWLFIVLILFVTTLAFRSQLMEIVGRLPVIRDWTPVLTIKNKWAQSFFGPEIDIRSLIILPLCVIAPIMWFVYRKDPDVVWILQDLCGVFSCSYIIKTLRFGNLKLITTLVVVFFFYDIFMVYITPLFMKAPLPPPVLSNFTDPLWRPSTLSRVKRATGGTSVMESVATGAAGKSGEKIPMLFILPNLNFAGEEIVQVGMERSFALLGFGDIIIPGILVAFSFYCDTALSWAADRRCAYVYSPLCIAGYHVGLVLVYIILYVMQTGQPALITLIPCSLLPVLVAAAARGQLRQLWTGLLPGPPAPDQADQALDGGHDDEEEEEEGGQGRQQSMNNVTDAESPLRPGRH